MIYPFHCANCNLEKEVVRPSCDHRLPENCDKCGKPMVRIFTAFQFSGSKNEWPEFNPAFGKVIRNKYHRKEEAQKAGMIEVGNEKVESMHKYFEKQRADKHKAGWEKVINEVV